ncbi:MAG: M6 family metalloprotease domain-containing protein [Candidatus Limnocylindrales bacterium]
MAMTLASSALAAAAPPAGGVLTGAPAEGDGGASIIGSTPAAPIDVWLTQPDGTRFLARAFGDASMNGYETPDGFTVAQDRAGTWRYATDRPDERTLTVSSPRAETAPLFGAQPHLRPERPSAGVSASPGSAGPGRSIGSQPTLVILVQFANQRSVGSTAADWARRFFGASNSVRDYYDEASYGNLSITPAKERYREADDGVVGWLTLRGRHPDTRGVTGANERLARRAIRAADRYVDFDRFDRNGDRRLTVRELHIAVVVAGYETAYGGASAACGPSVWAHHSRIGSGTAPTLDRTVVAGPGGGYLEFGEWHCTRGDGRGHLATIGPMAHELGHDLGWPDLYDTDLSSKGAGKWSLMGTGSWNRVGSHPSGSSPAHPDAFSKVYQGWVTPMRMVGNASGVTIAAGSTRADIKQLLPNRNGVDWSYRSHRGHGEYYLVENRQRIGYDAGLPGCGVLIWHIDETRTSSNSANSAETRKLVDLVEADGRGDLDRNVNGGDGGDPYPGTSHNLSFGRKSAPTSRSYAGKASGVSVRLRSRTCSRVMVADFTAPLDGSNTTPTIRDIRDQRTPVNTAEGPLAVTIGDAETNARRLTVSASASDRTLVPNGNFAFGGRGAKRTLTVTSARRQSGRTTITVTVSDGRLIAEDSFVLTVTAQRPIAGGLRAGAAAPRR